MEDKVIYFKDPIKNWQKQLIKDLKSSDECIVIDTDNNGQYNLVHKKSGYKGWISKESLSDKSCDKTITEIKKIDWDEN